MIQFEEEYIEKPLRPIPEEKDFNQHIDGIIGGHAYVDLGLSNGLLFATCNLEGETYTDRGSNERVAIISNLKQNSFGDWYTWNYKGDIENVSEEKLVFANINDISTIKWGEDWKTPTIEELNTLVRECRWIPCSVKGTDGFIVEGPNKHKIFLPTYAKWFRTPAKDVYHNPLTNTYESYGTIPFSSKYLSSSINIQVNAGKTELNYSLGIYFNYNEPDYNITYDESLKKEVDEVYDVKYSFIRPVVRYKRGSLQIFKNDNLDLQPIDLGLSRKWSPINLGSKNEKDAGWYFHWAGTTKIDESNHCKINKDIQHEEKEIIGGDKYKDAVTSILGEGWRTPSKQDFEELLDKCTWEKEFEDYIFTGYRVTGPNGNSIFLPLTDYISPENRHLNIKTYYGGSYWSSESCEEDATMNNAWCLRFNNHGKDVYWNHIWKTKAVRPVHD